MKTNLLLFTTGLILLFSAGVRFPILDHKADLYFKDAIMKTGLAYGASRLINGGVSVIKESEVSLEPMGLGVSIAAGQVLDPIDDMTERLSDVLVTAIASLGTQKLVHEVAIELSPVLMGIFILSWCLLSIVLKERSKFTRRLLFKLAVVLAVFRICLPLSAFVNDWVYESVFSEKIEQAKTALPFQSGDIDKLIDMTIPESDGVWDATQKSFDLMSEKTKRLKNVLIRLYANSSNIILNLTTLTFLYVGLFVIQVLLIPLVIFYLMSRLLNSLFHTTIPPVLKHRGEDESVELVPLKPATIQ